MGRALKEIIAALPAERRNWNIEHQRQPASRHES
jgi:hypothetical protein